MRYALYLLARTLNQLISYGVAIAQVRRSESTARRSLLSLRGFFCDFAIGFSIDVLASGSGNVPTVARDVRSHLKDDAESG